MNMMVFLLVPLLIAFLWNCFVYGIITEAWLGPPKATSTKAYSRILVGPDQLCRSCSVKEVSKTRGRTNDRMYLSEDLNQILDGAPNIRRGRRNFDRRSFLRSLSFVTAVAFNPSVARSAVTDATDAFADTDWVTGGPNTKKKGEFAPSDEVPIRFNKELLRDKYQGRLGLELVDIEFRTNLRVRVQSVQTASYAAALGVQPSWVIVSVNGTPTERTNAAGARQFVAEAVTKKNNDDIVIVFRDPSIFQEKMRTLSSVESDELPTVTTQVAPAGDTTQRNADGSVKTGRSITTAATDQRVTVQQLQAPLLCTRGATTDDLMEISYIGVVVETGQIFDGSAVLIDGKGIPGRGNDVSLFFVLGKQPFGQFPPGWDVGLVGMCVGERRRLILPPALGYGPSGLPRRNIPPNATLQYDVTLVSLNGLATPQ
jgi:FK506-binding protein 2